MYHELWEQLFNEWVSYCKSIEKHISLKEYLQTELNYTKEETEEIISIIVSLIKK